MKNQFLKFWFLELGMVGGQLHQYNNIPEKVKQSIQSEVSTWTTKNAQTKLPFLQTKEQIEDLKSINGLSIEEIEERARPERYSTQGFLGEKERFKDVLRKDWETVEKLQVTHAALAAHLTNIVSIAEKIQRSQFITKDLNRRYFDPDVIQYHTKDLKDNSIFSEIPQTLEVKLMEIKKVQKDLFAPANNSQRDVDKPKELQEECLVENPANKMKLSLNPGILSYIREFGFYGGNESPYRIDPLQVFALLTGKSLEELRQF